MQRYGWQARNSRSIASQTSQTNPNMSNSNASQIQGTSSLNSNLSKYQAQSSNNQNNKSTTEPQRQLFQNQARITRVSSISSNPLFQGLDIVPPRKMQTKFSQPVLSQNFSKGKQDQNEAFSQSMSQTSSQGSKLISRSNRNRQENVQQEKSLPIGGVANYQKNQFEVSAAGSRTMNKKQLYPRIQPQIAQTSKIQLQQQIPNLRFNKTSKKSESLLQMQNNPSMTQRPPATNKYPIQPAPSTKGAQPRRPLATQRKSGDDLIDDLLGNSKRVLASKSSRIQSDVSDFDNSSNAQVPKVQRYGFGRRQVTPQSQNVQLKKQISQKDEETQLTRSRNISIKSNTQANKFSQKKREKQDNQLSNKSGFQSNYQTPITKLAKDTPLRQSHTSQFQIIPERKSNIIIFCLTNLYKRKINEYFTLLNQIKQRSQSDNKIRLVYLSHLEKMVKNNNFQMCAYAFSKLGSSSVLASSYIQKLKLPISKSSKIDKIINHKNILANKIEYLFKDRLQRALVRIKKIPQKTFKQLINLIAQFEKKMIKMCFNKIYIASKYDTYRNENYTKIIVLTIQHIVRKRLRKSFWNLAYFSKSRNGSGDQNDKYEIQQEMTNDQNLGYQSPINPKHERAISSHENYFYSSQSKKEITAKQVGQIKSSKQSIRKTTMAEDTRALKLEKELKQVSKQNDKQVNNLQFRVEEIKQVISQYNFQLDYKNMRKRELQEIISTIPKHQQSMDRDRSIISSILKLPVLAQLYFTVVRNPEYQIQVNELASMASKNIEFSSDTDEPVEGWLLMLRNGRLKKQIDAYEQNIVGEEGPTEERKKTSWVYAYQEQEVISKLVRSYVKQLYYWATVKSALSKVAASQRQQ